jgi:hypothetical protein
MSHGVAGHYLAFPEPQRSGSQKSTLKNLKSLKIKALNFKSFHFGELRKRHPRWSPGSDA